MVSPCSLRQSVRGLLTRLALAALATAYCLPRTMAQAVITWGVATEIAGDTDVQTTGTLVSASHLGTSSVSAVTVNGVVFAAFPFPNKNAGIQSVTIGTINFTENPQHLDGVTLLGSALAPFSTLSTDYQSLLSSAGSTGDPEVATLTLTLNGLTSGHSYLLQWWTNSSKGTFASTVAFDAFDNTLALGGSTGSAGSVGQFGIGTFTAIGTSQAIMFDGIDSQPLINAFQLRDVSAIPEPSACAGLLAVAAFGLTVHRRNSRARATRQ